MQVDGALVKEQGKAFGIVIVKASAMSSPSTAVATRTAFQGLFPGVPIILASQNASGEFSYHGRRDIVDLLASMDASQIPWERYTFA